MVGERGRRLRQLVVEIIDACLVVEVGAGPTRPRRALGIEKADDQLRASALLPYATATPWCTEIGDVPSTGHQPEESSLEAEYGFDGEMGEVVPRKERSLSAQLALPRHAAVRAGAAQRG